MLIKCPECELQVSDKAPACPHCGYPMQPTAKRKPRAKNNKRRRLPNGFGQITEIKTNNLRKPFRAMVTVGKTPEGKPICRPLKPKSYFLTYNDAYAALVEYNKNPYDLEPSITVKELYVKWTEEYFKTLKADGSVRAVTSAWAYCSAVYNMRVKDVRARHVKGCMEEGTAVVRGREQHPSASMKNKIKSLFNLMLDYALEYEVVPIHSRIRPLVERKYKEALTIGSKYLFNCTDGRSGKPTIMTYQRYQKGFGMVREELKLNPEHRPHDGRKHFVTACKKAGVDEYAIKYMVGHKISDITEKVYTQREFEWLKQEIEKIK